jgi:hypothetical protein
MANELRGFKILGGRDSDSATFPKMQLGKFVFLVQPKERITIAMTSSLAEHSTPGRGPRYEYMGDAPLPWQWEGQFRDTPITIDQAGTQVLYTAWDQFKDLYALRKTFQKLQYGRLRARVWVEEVTIELRYNYRIDYRLTLKTDYGNPKRSPIRAVDRPEEFGLGTVPSSNSQLPDTVPREVPADIDTLQQFVAAVYGPEDGEISKTDLDDYMNVIKDENQQYKNINWLDMHGSMTDVPQLFLNIPATLEDMRLYVAAYKQNNTTPQG